jgi:secreted Zn-dependent insulinase-like peptidase
MTLAIAGKESLDVLEGYARKYFSPIRNFDAPSFEQEIINKDVLSELYLEQKIFVEPCIQMFLDEKRRNPEFKLKFKKVEDSDIITTELLESDDNNNNSIKLPFIPPPAPVYSKEFVDGKKINVIMTTEDDPSISFFFLMPARRV